MATATALSLFFIPVLYYGVQSLVDKLKGSPAAPALDQVQLPVPTDGKVR
jgi:hypothetical protein